MSDDAEADAWMDTQDEALTVALSGLVKERHLMIRSARSSDRYRVAAYLRRLYPRRLIRAMIRAELLAEVYRQKKETLDVFPDIDSAIAAVEDAFLSNMRRAGYDATREKWVD